MYYFERSVLDRERDVCAIVEVEMLLARRESGRKGKDSEVDEWYLCCLIGGEFMHSGQRR